jgi:hypothetical protein
MAVNVFLQGYYSAKQHTKRMKHHAKYEFQRLPSNKYFRYAMAK